MRTWTRLISFLGIVAVMATSCWAKDDTIILRLEDDSAPANASPQPSSQPANKDIEQIPNPATKYRTISPPALKCGSAVLMDAQSGQIIYAKNPHQRLPNASTTKMITAILLIEKCGMSQKIKASKHACETPFTSLNLRPGECISARDLLAGMMVRSANDAAVAVAEHVSGSVSKFASLMNKKAIELGCKDTHFVTPNGLYAKDHYSSAYDLCLIARYGLRYPVFNEFAAMRKHMLLSRTMNRKDLALFSRNKFLRNYPGADGVKSGYIKQAGYCYVGSATRNGWRLVSAVLKSDNSSVDTAVLMDYGFNNFESRTVARANVACVNANIKGGSAATAPAAPVSDLRVVTPRTGARVTTNAQFKELTAPIDKGTKVGVLTASVDGVPVASVELRATGDVGISMGRRIWGLTKICSIVMLCLVMGNIYVTTTAKNARRRRRRVTAQLRGFDRYR